MIPKPPKRINDKELLSRFATRPWCQICGRPDSLHIHHLKIKGVHPRADVIENLMRLCYRCHDQYHSEAKWTLQQLIDFKTVDEQNHGDYYLELEP